jgi:sortase A
MKNNRRSASFALFLFAIVFTFLPLRLSLGENSITTIQSVNASTITTSPPIQYDYPIRIIAPSIKLNSPIQGMGVNKKGELDVPSGKTNNVGWYKNGTVPGQSGAAVLDAHVFAAFSNLKYLAPGSDIYIEMASGKKLHFTVDIAKKYKLTELSPTALFQTTSDKKMNLITCAGTFIKNRATYDHRLIVYTTLQGIEV